MSLYLLVPFERLYLWLSDNTNSFANTEMLPLASDFPYNHYILNKHFSGVMWRPSHG